MNQFYSVFYVCIHVTVTTARDRVICEEHSVLTFCRQDSPRSRHQQYHCLKRNVLCVQDGTVCRSSGGSNACLHNRKTTEERGNVCWNFKPFCKGFNLILKDGVCMAQSPPQTELQYVFH